RRLVVRREIEPLGGGGRPRVIVGRVAGIEHGLRHAAVDEPGVEVPQAVMRGEPLAKRPLTRGRRPVDGNDHESSAPRLRIRDGKPGKLVAIIPASSTATGFSLAKPMTRNAWAVGCSVCVVTIRPPLPRAMPWTMRPSP